MMKKSPGESIGDVATSATEQFDTSTTGRIDGGAIRRIEAFNNALETSGLPHSELPSPLPSTARSGRPARSLWRHAPSRPARSPWGRVSRRLARRLRERASGHPTSPPSGARSEPSDLPSLKAWPRPPTRRMTVALEKSGVRGQKMRGMPRGRARTAPSPSSYSPILTIARRIVANNSAEGGLAAAPSGVTRKKRPDARLFYRSDALARPAGSPPAADVALRAATRPSCRACGETEAISPRSNRNGGGFRSKVNGA